MILGLFGSAASRPVGARVHGNFFGRHLICSPSTHSRVEMWRGGGRFLSNAICSFWTLSRIDRLPSFLTLATYCVDLEPRLLPFIGITSISPVPRASPPPQHIRPIPRGRPGGRRNRPCDGASLNCHGLPLVRMQSPVPRQSLWVRVAHYPRDDSLHRNLGV